MGEVTVYPPTRFDAVVWRRRTHCRHCRWAQDELRGPLPLAITSRHQPIDWRGGNPFEGTDAVEEE
jgi:hypothetical protein